MSAARSRRPGKRHAVALFAILAEIVAGVTWWRRRRGRRDEDLSRDA